ncbi:MAG: DUF819 family protein [Deltaproteobacteria bacterium]|nr:DUF819 family protein [Deltaproteobacteria bacterium]
MGAEILILVILATSALCLAIEKQVAWWIHINGICLTILVALFLSAIGVIPHHHFLYDFFSTRTTPMAIAMLLLSLNIREIAYLPRFFLWIYGAGICGSVLGAIIAAMVGSMDLGLDAAKLAAQLGASYIGGGENAVAMKVILAIPNELFVGSFAVDNVLTSLWMFMAIMYAGSRFSLVDTSSDRKTADPAPNILEIVFIGFLALLVVQVATWLTATVGMLHRYLYISGVAVAIGQISFVQRHVRFAYPLGVILFIPFFFSIGAMSDFASLAQLPWAALYMPMVIVIVHGTVMLTCGHYFKIPRHYVAVASQSLIGGPSTAVAVAQAKNWRSGIPIAIIAGILGYAIANFCGMGIYHIARFMITLWGYHGHPQSIS